MIIKKNQENNNYKLSLNQWKHAVIKFNDLIKVRSEGVNFEGTNEDKYTNLKNLETYANFLRSVELDCISYIIKNFGASCKQFESLKDSKDYIDILLDIILYGFYHDIYGKKIFDIILEIFEFINKLRPIHKKSYLSFY